MTTLKLYSFLERERDLRPRGRSWPALGPSVGGLRPLWEPMLVGRSWNLSCRSWAALGPILALLGSYVGSRGRLLKPMGLKYRKNIAILKISLFLERERDLRPRERSWADLGTYAGGLVPLF